ncbi:MAG: hypothetical protein EHM90_06275, partial [Chloroflexi bacterium]
MFPPWVAPIAGLSCCFPTLQSSAATRLPRAPTSLPHVPRSGGAGSTAAGGASSVSVNAVTDAASCRVLYWRLFLPESWDADTGGGRPARCRAGTAVARPRPTVTGVPTHPSPRRHGAAFTRTCPPRPRETLGLAHYRCRMQGAVNPDIRRSRRLARILAANPRAAIYGTIVASAVIATTAGGHESPALILEATLATLLVFWLAHVYADFLNRPGAC